MAGREGERGQRPAPESKATTRSSPKRLGKGSRPDLPRRKAEEQSAAPPNTLNPWTALRKENTSFADILKKDPVVASDKPAKSGKSARTEVKSGKLSQSAAGRRLPRKTGERKLDNAGARFPLTPANQISAATYGRIGRTTEAEKYVMPTFKLPKDEVLPWGHSPQSADLPQVVDLEVEFRAQHPSEREDVEIEFLEPKAGSVDQFVNKISAGTYRRIGKTEDNKYVMSARPATWSAIVEQKTVEAPATPNIHEMIKEKMKKGEELTEAEREILREKRRLRRRREKENKRREKEEDRRNEMMANKGVKLGFISRDVLNRVAGPGSKAGKPTTAAAVKKKDSERNHRPTLKFRDEEYPDLGPTASQPKQKGKVLHSETRDSAGHLVVEESGTDWETDYSEVEQEARPESGAQGTAPSIVIDPGPISYSSILKAAKQQLKPPQQLKQQQKNTEIGKGKSNKAETKQQTIETEAVKKKTKAKDPFELDLFSALLKKKVPKKEKKVKAVLGGKLQKEPSKVRNVLDSSAPAKKRGKEREGGKKKKLTKVKKIILKEKARKRTEREEAAARREHRLKEGIRLAPLPLEDSDLPPATSTNEIPALSESIGALNLDADEKKTDQETQDGDMNDNCDTTRAATKDEQQQRISTEHQQQVQQQQQQDVEKEIVAEEVAKPPPTKLERAKQKIHNRKYRDYCEQDLSKDLDTYVANLMTDLIRFQDRQHAKDPVKAKARRRYVVGLREVTKFIKVKKVTCVIFATDLEKISSEGGLDSAVDSILSLCAEQTTPVIFSRNRYKLGKVCLRKVPVSCIAILNYQGSDENYQHMLELGDLLRQSYQAKLKTEMDNIDALEEQKEEEQQRPASSLQYSPGKEFFPRGYVHQDVLQSSSADVGYSNYWYTNYETEDNTNYESKQSQYGYYDHRYTQAGAERPLTAEGRIQQRLLSILQP